MNWDYHGLALRVLLRLVRLYGDEAANEVNASPIETATVVVRALTDSWKLCRVMAGLECPTMDCTWARDAPAFAAIDTNVCRKE